MFWLTMSMTRFVPATICSLLAALLLAASAASAAPPPLRLDPGFGHDGVVRGGSALSGYPRMAGLAVAPSGDVLVAAVAREATALARYLPDGELDPSFGDHGVSRQLSVPAVPALSIESIGGISGLAATTEGGAVLLWQGSNLTRTDSHGNLDPSFGSGGTVALSRLEPRFGSLHFNALAVLADGRIVVGGISYGAPQMVVARLLADGRLDPSFGDRGLATIRFGAGTNSGVRRLAVAADGDIVLAGYAHNNPALVRLLPNGSPNPGFARHGRAVAPRWLHGQATALTPAPHGGVVASCGPCWLGGTDRAVRPLLRYGPRGNWDRRVATAGLGRAAPPSFSPHSLFLAGPGAILVGGSTGPAVRVFGRDGSPGPSLAGVAGVPRGRIFGVFAAVQGEKLLLAWTPGHSGRVGELRLERFRLR